MSVITMVDNKWIACDSGIFPRVEQRVLIVFQWGCTGNRQITIAEYVPRHTVLAEDFLSVDCDPAFLDVEEDTGIEYAPQGWYESHAYSEEPALLISETVLCWMPLPDMPKKGGD